MGEPQTLTRQESTKPRAAVKSRQRKGILALVLSAALVGAGGAAAWYFRERNAPALATAEDATPQPNEAGLVPLPCALQGALRPQNPFFCTAQRHYVTPYARAALVDAAVAMAPSRVLYMEASWPSGVKPMPPHLSHGDGREVDLAIYYVDLKGRPLRTPPRPAVAGYGAFEPPLHESERLCASSKHYRPDPPPDRAWRLDEQRTKQLVATLAADKRVKRIFIEPHLKKRLGFAADPKVRFAGCNAARHDDHLHVDFY